MIYLLHFDTPYKHARHYIGFTENLRARMHFHRTNKGANLLRVLNGLGIKYHLTMVRNGTRIDERIWKRRKNAPKVCPICRLMITSNTGKVKYFCNKCSHKHFIDSLAGKKHYLFLGEKLG